MAAVSLPGIHSPAVRESAAAKVLNSYAEIILSLIHI